MKAVDLQRRTRNFAHSSVKLIALIGDSKLSNHIQGQLIRSATSVAAYYRAASIAQTKKSFIA